jgi:RNA polymerase-binding protein DksA
MVMKHPNRAYLTPAEIRKFKAILLVKRNEILGDITSMEAESLLRQISDLSRLPIHLADLGTDNYEIENTIGLMDSERKLLGEIDGALDRIEDGTYGICQGSGKPIPKDRLEAIPWAKYCVEYASLVEKGLVRKEDSFIIHHHDYDTEDDEDDEPRRSYRKAQ